MKNIYYLVFLIFLFISSCSENDNPLAPYAGSPVLSNIIIERATFKPKISWVGGYASVFGVNRNSTAALDSSLVWLIHTNGNNLRYPLTFGNLPSGAEDLTAQFGGVKLDSLEEDERYTFWIMKEDVWNQVSVNPNKKIAIDTSLTASSVIISGDSIHVSPYSLTTLFDSADVYINIRIQSIRGTLADLLISETYSNKPIVSWNMKAPYTDTLISAIGINEGADYSPTATIWEMYSVTDSSGIPLYGRENVIPPYISIGDSVAGTHTFTHFKLEGLERNKGYYIWIANNVWDQKNRLRTAAGYAAATFQVY